MDYPFAALVGQDQLKLALLLNAVYPGVGGVLVRGEKGTAKSTAARALADLLPPLTAVAGCPYRCDPAAPWVECPHCAALTEHRPVETPAPFVDLPIGATEDRVLGTLDFERALREGKRAFQPGLLAGAHRGVLYIDEVNLLPDHLVDVLLDAAALGVNTVQREGVAFIHPACFLLIGTMNPEEGDLRPQFLDRFGLMVTVAASREPEMRAEVVRRRMACEADAAAFDAHWSEEQGRLRERIMAARALLPTVVLDDGLLTFLSRLCCEFAVDGLRGDVVLHRTARALAAWQGRGAVTLDDIRTAAELALPHRCRRRPFEQPGLDKERLGQLFDPPPPEKAHDNGSAAESEEKSERASEGGSKVFAPTPPAGLRRIQVSADTAAPRPGRRNPAPPPSPGHYVRAVRDASPSSLALDATIRAAGQRGAVSAAGGIAVEPQDLHGKVRAGRTATLILFVVDASGSMAARQRMEAVKGAVLALLKDAYEQRDQVGVIAFRGPEAELLLPPTQHIEPAERSLRDLPTGGRTPLAHALVMAHETIERGRRQGRGCGDVPTLLVLLSDGKANVSLPGTTDDPWQQAVGAAATLAGEGVPALVLDTDAGFVRLGRAAQLAAALEAEHLPLEELSAEALVLHVRRGVPTRRAGR